MPQDQLLQDSPRYDGVQITFTEVPLDGGQTWNFVVKRKAWAGHWETVHASRVGGYMVDFVTTYASEAVSAFFFGDDRDLSRTLAGVARLARRHARRHERVR